MKVNKESYNFRTNFKNDKYKDLDLKKLKKEILDTGKEKRVISYTRSRSYSILEEIKSPRTKENKTENKNKKKGFDIPLLSFHNRKKCAPEEKKKFNDYLHKYIEGYNEDDPLVLHFIEATNESCNHFELLIPSE